MQPCPTCLAKLSPKARACPSCGHPIKKSRTKVLGRILISLISLIIIISIIDSPAQPDSPQADSPAIRQPASHADNKSSTATKKSTHIYKEGDTVEIGYTTYVVWESYWTDRLTDNAFLNSGPDARYLVIEISVRNDDTQSRSIPPFKLTDTAGREYSTTADAFMMPDHIGILSSLNPDVQKDGLIAFDCPAGREYKLKVSGGYWTSKNALIQLKPLH